MSNTTCNENVDVRLPEKSLDEQVMRKSLLPTKLVVNIMLVAIGFLAFFSIDTPLTQATFGSSDILFENGAESGVLQPPFDVCVPPTLELQTYQLQRQILIQILVLSAVFVTIIGSIGYLIYRGE